MKYIKVLFALLALCFLLNFLSWAFIGREHSLLLATREWDTWGAVQPEDSLHIFWDYKGRTEDEGRYISEFRKRTIQELVSQLEEEKFVRRVRIHEDTFSTELDGELGERGFAFSVLVDEALPFVVEVSVSYYAPGFVTGHEEVYLWFFGWHHLKQKGIWVS